MCVWRGGREGATKARAGEVRIDKNRDSATNRIFVIKMRATFTTTFTSTRNCTSHPSSSSPPTYEVSITKKSCVGESGAVRCNSGGHALPSFERTSKRGIIRVKGGRRLCLDGEAHFSQLGCARREERGGGFKRAL